MAKVIKARKKGFTTTSNVITEDSRLHWYSRGIFYYMFAQSADWQFYTSELVNHSDQDGIDLLRKGLRELEDYGYLKRVQQKDGNGRFGRYDWFISDEPMFDVPDTDLPDTVSPDTALPDTVNPTLTNTNKTNTNKTSTNNTEDDDEQVINTSVKKAFNENKLQNQNEYSAVVTKRLLPLVKNVDSVKELNAMFDDALKDALDKSNLGKVQKPVSYAITIVSNAVDWGAKNYDQFIKFTKSEQRLLNQDFVPKIVTDIDIQSLDLTQLKKEEQNNE